jgi:triosephosphate isomerase
MRRPFVAGNWKMNLERKSALGLVAEVRERVGQRADIEVAVCPPFVYLDEIARALSGSPIRVGAQNCCDEESGAFTGEISAAMLIDVGCDLVILGHSERRQL